MASMAGGALWAVTPLREPLLGGRFPEHPVFRPYDLVLVVIVVLLIVGLLALHNRNKGNYGRLGAVGFVITLAGYALLFFGSLPAVLLSPDGLRGLIIAGQDLGFLGALVAGVGAILLGVALWRTSAASRIGALLLIRPSGWFRRRDRHVCLRPGGCRRTLTHGPVRRRLDNTRETALVAEGGGRRAALARYVRFRAPVLG